MDSICVLMYLSIVNNITGRSSADDVEIATKPREVYKPKKRAGWMERAARLILLCEWNEFGKLEDKMAKYRNIGCMPTVLGVEGKHCGWVDDDDA